MSNYLYHKNLGNILIYIASFPFVINIFPDTDTQPTYAIFFIFITIMTFFSGRGYIRGNNKALIVIVLASFLLSFLTITFSGKDFYIYRLGSFYLFLLSMYSVNYLNKTIEPKTILNILYIYIFFSFIYFISQGFIESSLISSRGEQIGQNFISGRGASTLSPEPSFFVFQIVSLFIFYKLTSSHNEYDAKITLCTIFLLIISFSGYGLIYAIILTLFLSFRERVIGLFLVFVLSQYLIDSFLTIRGRFVLQEFYEYFVMGNEITDVSINARMVSLVYYLEDLSNNLFLGNGFSLYYGGGFIGIIASLGVFYVLFFMLIFLSIFLYQIKLNMKILLLFWFIFQFISGPTGVPFYGIIIGLIVIQSRIFNMRQFLIR